MSDPPDAELREVLTGLFREELQDNLRLLAAGLSDLEGEPSPEVLAARVPELFRAAHSLKGAAHSAGVVTAVEPCRRLEESLALLRDGGRVLDGELLAAFRADIESLAAIGRGLHRTTESPSEPDVAEASARADAWHLSREPDASAHRPRARVAVGSIDVLVDQVDALSSATQRLELLASELIVTRDEGTATPDLVESVTAEVGSLARDLGRATRRVAESAQRLRMQSIADATAGLEHTVAEVARATGKQARLMVRGGDVTVDRDVGDALREPLLHLVRNAVDHGIEAPERRRAGGKPPQGSVWIEAALEGGRVRLVVADDGAGIDVAALAAAARTDGTPSEEGFDLAFRAGLSTAEAVTDVSGRGVGLDAVRARVESLGGTAHLRPRPAGGTEAVLHVPMTLAVLRIVLVTAGSHLLGIPAGAVRRAHRVEPSQLQHLEGRVILTDGGGARPATSLAAALGFPASDDGPPTTVIELVGEDGVLLVDRVDSELEAVLRRLPPRVGGAASVLGAVMLPSERVALVVSPSACLRADTTVVAPRDRGERRVHPTVLLAEDTATTRALEHSVLASAGYEVIDAIDGVEAWEILTERKVDLVVSDVDMPRMGGIELCRAIRSSGRFAEVPVVLVTSLATDDDRRRGLEAGANAYLVKSAFDQATLLDTVRSLL